MSKLQNILCSLVIAVFLLSTYATCMAFEEPDIVELGILANIYQPVVFDHSMHVEAT